jgi:hypothetical protein
MVLYRSYRRMHRLLRLCAALLIAGLFAARPATTPVTQAATQSPNGPGIPCDQTPFGHVLKLNQKNEIFLGLADTSDSRHPLTAYRIGTDATGQLQQQFVSPSAQEPANVSGLAGTAADVDGDGKDEFIQGFNGANGGYDVLVRRNGGATQLYSVGGQGYRSSAMAAGDIQGRDDGSQQVVIASLTGDGLSVAVLGRDPAGSFGNLVASWASSTNNRVNASQIHVAVGNLNNNRTADIVVSLLESDQHTEQIIHLEYQPGYATDAAFNLQERAFVTELINPTHTTSIAGAKIVMASFNGSPQQSVVLAYDLQDSTGDSVMLVINNYSLVTVNGVAQFVQKGLWINASVHSRSFDIAAGHLYGDARDELVIGYDDSASNTLNFETISMTGANTAAPKLVSVDHWRDGSNDRNATDDLALALGDLNKDNRAEVVAAFTDANPFGFQALYLSEQLDQNSQPGGLKLVDWGRHDATFNAPPTIALGDWNNESVHATVSGTCARVVDANITAVGFVPPYWRNIQGSQAWIGGSIGRSVTQEASSEQSLTYHRSDTVSVYAGAGLDVDIPGVLAISASARQTGAREAAMSNRQTTGVVTTTVTTVGQSWGDDAVVYDPTEYNCYRYQLSVDGVALPPDKANVRYCQYEGLPGATPQLQASELNSWDANFGAQPEYAPVARDWTSLTLFRGAFTDQSSNKALARLAVDGVILNGSYTNGTVTQTANESHPWWQVDLGAVQPLTKIRLWTLPGSLSNVYLFVSDTDFRTIPGGNDPQTLLSMPNVRHYTLADLGNGFKMTDAAPPEATFLTLDAQHQPIHGRYVRVQRADTAVLSLAEVQVFGANHVEPDRYPLDMRDSTPNDGAFEVLLYNPYHTSASDMYQWVPTRGNLLWDGRQSPALNALGVNRGNTIVNWSLSKGTGNTQVQAHELDNSTSAGTEFEGEAGEFIKVVAGGGTEHTTGLATETTLSTSWSSEFNMGGQMQGFPHEYDGIENSWVLSCAYRFQPYQYEITDTSNLGHQHRYPVLDYLVPSGGRVSDLDRTVDLAACRNGNQISATPQTNNDSAQAIAGQPTTLNVLANDMGNNLTITAVGPAQHGTVTHTDRTVTYTPSAGFTGTDSFTYSVSDGTSGQTVARAVDATTGTVTIRVGTGNSTIIYLPLIRR